MSRPGSLAPVVLAFLAAACGTTAPPAPPPARSVLFVLVDALRRDHVGVYGRQPSPTPSIDALAGQGTVFDHAIAPSAWTRSSLAAILASRFPTSLAVLDRSDAVPDSVVLLPEVLRQRGLRTLGVWSNANVNEAFGFASGYETLRYPAAESSYPGDFVVPTADGVTKAALELAGALRPDDRFFLYVHYVDAHDPYLPHPEFAATPEPAGAFSGSRKDLERLDALLQPKPADTDRIKFLYRNAVAYADHCIGELVAGLRARQLDRDLLVVITADHGEGLWDHGVRGHGRDLYEEMIGVPLIIASTSRTTAAPLHVSEPVSMVDLAPTILAAANLLPAPTFTGTDLAPFTSGARPRRISPLYAEVRLDGVDLETIRQGPLKLIRSRGGQFPKPTELFDLAADPGERTNLVDARPDRVIALSQELAKTGDGLKNAAASARPAGPLDRQSRENLRALGYMGSRSGSGGPGLQPVVDFAAAGGAAAQLLNGFFPPEGGRRWMGPHAEVVLGRDGPHRKWTLTAEADPSFPTRPFRLLVRANAAAPAVLAVPNGRFILSGDLPDDGQSRVRLVLDCSASFVPARQNPKSRDVRELCLNVYAIGLTR